jgi:hypothetical protein
MAEMSKTSKPSNEIDDYIAAFSYEERQEYAAAEMALDLATMLYYIRKEQGPGQQHDAERAGLKRRAISSLEKSASTIQIGTLQSYLSALGYDNEAGN